jgi:hypothetical protein
VSLDLPDPKGSDVLPTEFDFPGLNLMIPVRLDLTGGAALRVDGRALYSRGTDRITWTRPGVGPQTDPAEALLGVFGATVGPEVRFVPSGPVSPYFAAGVGAMVANTWHVIDRPELFDPEKYPPEELGENTNRVDPYTTQLVPAGVLALGVHLGAAWLEVGYDAIWVPRATLVGSPEEVGAERAKYGWNAVRIAIGAAIPVGE